MYPPKLYREEDRTKIIQFLKQNNFPTIISHDGEKIIATHSVVEVVEKQDGSLTIYAHISRANPQWKSFGEQEVLLIFQGAHAYISPRWYNHINVPTWNYMMVHVYGKVRMIEGQELYELLSRLVSKHEVNTGYSLENLPQDFVQKEIKGVTGFAVDVTRIDARYKLSQNRDDESYENVIHELEKQGDENSLLVAEEMKKRR